MPTNGNIFESATEKFQIKLRLLNFYFQLINSPGSTLQRSNCELVQKISAIHHSCASTLALPFT